MLLVMLLLGGLVASAAFGQTRPRQEPPAVAPGQTLVLTFDEALDLALAERGLKASQEQVRAARGASPRRGRRSCRR
jgi:hypothetical protein